LSGQIFGLVTKNYSHLFEKTNINFSEDYFVQFCEHHK